MWPFLKPGDKLIVKKFPLEDLSIGDIILYIKDSQPVCHRLIKKIRYKEGYLLYTRGDNSKSAESVIGDMFRGKAIGVLRKGHIKNLTTRYQRFINRAIVIMNPLIRGSLKVVKFMIGGKNGRKFSFKKESRFCHKGN